MMSDPYFAKKIETLIEKLDPDEFDKETKPKKGKMKYVRTKDGIWLNCGKFGKPQAGIIGKKHEIDFGYCFGEKEIIKEADDIEKLFDEYVLENKDHTYQSLLVKSDDGDKLSFSDGSTKDVKNGWYSDCSEYLKNGCTIYGAIVVRGKHDEPILKPVAKMKREGEWELL